MYTIANIRPFGHNVGNAAISFALRQLLYETFGRLVTVIDYPATAKHETTAKAGLTRSTVHEINRFVDGVIVGGGNLYENDEIDVDPSALEYLKAPLMLFSNSRGRIYGRNGSLEERTDVISDAKLRLLIGKATISASRDSATHQYISKLSLSDELGYCPTINLKAYEAMLPALPASELVGSLISIRTPSLMNVPMAIQSRIQNDIEEIIRTLRQCGHERVRILCNDSRDLDFATQFKGAMNVDPIFTTDVYQYLALLKKAKMVVSYRLHASLPAISFGTPVVNITYDERAESLCEDLGLMKDSVSLVRDRDMAADKICSAIRSGGYNAQAHLGNQAKWKSISVLQRDIFDRFKSSVEAYVSSCRI